MDRGGYFAKALKTRSLARSPVATVFRGLSYLALSRAGIPASFTIRFGEASFKMRLQETRAGFGIANIYLQRRYYESLLEFGHVLLSPGDTVIDGGASQGVYSCAFAARVGRAGHVYAFEPLPHAVQCLQNNIALNGFENVSVFQGALAQRSGSAMINLGKGPSYASIVHDYGVSDTREVCTFSIDALRRDGRLHPLNFIKLDVEGAEQAALEGARETLAQDRPRLCVEANEEAPFEWMRAFLAPLKLKPFVFDDRGALRSFTRFTPTPNVFFLP